MDFGKRFSVHNDRAPPVVQQTCVRCCGTGRVRERGGPSSAKPARGREGWISRPTALPDRPANARRAQPEPGWR